MVHLDRGGADRPKGAPHAMEIGKRIAAAIGAFLGYNGAALANMLFG